MKLLSALSPSPPEISQTRTAIQKAEEGHKVKRDAISDLRQIENRPVHVS